MTRRPSKRLTTEWLAEAAVDWPTDEPVEIGTLWRDSTGAIFLSIGIPPVFTLQPVNAGNPEGYTVTFTVTVTNYTTLQWQVDTGSGFANISGATSLSYTTPALTQPDDNNAYRCIAVGPGGTTTSNTAYSGVAPTGTVVGLATPVAWKLIQQSGGVASISITGTAANLDGTDVEASFNGGEWQSLATISSNAFSGTLAAQAAGRGTLTVRSKLYPVLEANKSNIGIGDIYLVSGDSISEGRVNNPQTHGLTTNKPSAYRQDDVWVEANDPCDTGSAASHWPLLAKLLTTASGYPVAFVTTGTGGKDIAGSGTSYYNKGSAGYDIITSQASEVGGLFKAMLLHLGTNAATDATLTRAAYKTALQTFAADIRADIQADLNLYLGVFGLYSTGFSNNAIRNAIADAVTSTASLYAGPNLLGLPFGDGVHPRSDDHAARTAGRWYAALSGSYSPNIISAVGLDTTVTITVDADLDTNVTNYTAAMFRVKQGASYTSPTTAIRTGARTIILTFAAAITDPNPTLDFVFNESHSTATLPTGSVVTLPSTINGVSTVSQPCNPCLDFVVSRKHAVNLSGAGWVSGTPINVFASANSFTFSMDITDTTSIVGYLFSRGGMFCSWGGSATLLFGSSAGYGIFPYSGRTGSWRFIYDLSASGFAKYRVFKNGVEIAKTSTSGTYADYANTSQPINFGRRDSGSGYLTCHLDVIKIWSRVVTPSDGDQSSNLVLSLGNIVTPTWYDGSANVTNHTLNGDAVAI